MPGCLLAISRDSGLVRGLGKVLLRSRGGYQIWAVEDIQGARGRLRGGDCLPVTIVLDEPYLRGEPLQEVTEELAWFAPLVVIARSERQASMALLVAAGKADFVVRDANYIPLALALAERALGRAQAGCEQAQPVESEQGEVAATAELPALKSLRLVGNLIDNLDVPLGLRRQLPLRLAKRLDRAADIAFELKHNLRCLVGQSATELETTRNR